MQVVAHNAALLPQSARHAGMKMATKKVKALFAFPEINHSGLLRMKTQTELTQ
jgi:hypothetical protein